MNSGGAPTGSWPFSSLSSGSGSATQIAKKLKLSDEAFSSLSSGSGSATGGAYLLVWPGPDFQFPI